MASSRPAPAAPKRTADNPKRESGSSAGMPSVTPGHEPSPQDDADALRDPAPSGLRLPHERDQSEAMTKAEPDAQVVQAGRDLHRGLQDTDKGVPMDKAYDKLKRP